MGGGTGCGAGCGTFGRWLSRRSSVVRSAETFANCSDIEAKFAESRETTASCGAVIAPSSQRTRARRMSRTTRIGLFVQPVFDGVARQLDAVGDLQLAERRLNVVFDSTVTERQPRGDLLGGQALGDVAQNLGFALGQARRRTRVGSLRNPPVLAKHQPRQARGEHRTALSRRSHG